jgi:rod shape-determining protein MreC
MGERPLTQAGAFAQTRRFYSLSYMIRFGVFSTIGLLLLMLNHLQPRAVFEVRRYLNDGVVSVLTTCGQPFTYFEKKLFHFQEFILSFQRFQFLEQQLQELETWQSRARQLLYENKKLRESLRYIKQDLPVVATARAFFSFDGRYLQSMIVDAGEKEGVQVNQPVVAYGRLIGRVVEVSPHSARVLLITDLYSRIPVETEWSQLRGILTGTNSKKLIFLHEREKKNLLEGELVFTTGEGGIFPPGYLIGTLSFTEAEEIFVDPGIEWRKIDMVQILQSSEETSFQSDHIKVKP